MYVIDRIINDIMVCEDLETGKTVNIDRIKNAKEGDVIKKVDNKFVIDLKCTEKRKLEISEKLKKLGYKYFLIFSFCTFIYRSLSIVRIF